MGILKSLTKILAAIVAILTPTPLNSKNLLTMVVLPGLPFQIFEASS
jgi:hypothetical protein